MEEETKTAPLIEWNQELEVGHREIDADHRAMIAMVNRIHAAGERADRAEALTALRELEDFTRSHFAREEALMDEIRYEFATRHRKEHLSLFEEIRDQVDDMHSGRNGICAIARFIRSWLIGHVAGSDRPLGKALQRRFRP